MPKSSDAKASKPSPKKSSEAKPAASKKAAPAAPAKKVSNGASGEKSQDKPADARHYFGPSRQKSGDLTPFLKRQQDRLLQLRDGMVDSMVGVAKDNLRSRAEGSEASAFGMHQADAGSDAYDRDFALSLLSQEQDALYEIDEALKRIDAGTYGVCEMSAKPIPHARLEAIPFARLTVDCQSQVEKQNKMSRSRVPVTSLFGLTDDEGGGGDSDEEEPASSSSDKE